MKHNVFAISICQLVGSKYLIRELEHMQSYLSWERPVLWGFG